MDDRASTAASAEPLVAELANLRFGDRGLTYRAARALHLLPTPGGRLWIALVAALFTWLPLLVLTLAVQVVDGPPTIDFSQSFGTHARFLVAIPLLFVAESLFSRRIREVLRRMLEAQIPSPRDLHRFISGWRRAHAAWDSPLIEAVLVAVTIVSIYQGLRADLPPGIQTWRTTSAGQLSLAGWWYTVVSLPFFQFLLWRWLVRLVIWAALLWRISRMELRLLPTHPDLAGGLGSLGVAQADLAPLAFALSATVAATFAEELKFGGAMIGEFATPATAVVVGTTVMLIAPLLLFSRRLLELKQRGLLEYGSFAMSYVRAFDTKWLRHKGSGEQPLLGTADLQSLADLANSFSVVNGMHVVPISRAQIVLIFLSAALPMVPLLLFAFPLDELIINVFKSVIGV